jgi:hypothetical protein
MVQHIGIGRSELTAESTDNVIRKPGGRARAVKARGWLEHVVDHLQVYLALSAVGRPAGRRPRGVIHIRNCKLVQGL